jgi:hypothetical protein
MQTVAEKYAPLISAVNHYVADFNGFLVPDHWLKLVDPTDAATFCVLADFPWNSRWPGSGYAGIYVFGACDEKNPSRVAAYVGKASFRNLEHNISSHLNTPDGREAYTMRRGPDTFRVEVLMVVPIVTPTMRSMACALEEHNVLNGLETRPAV